MSDLEKTTEILRKLREELLARLPPGSDFCLVVRPAGHGGLGHVVASGNNKEARELLHGADTLLCGAVRLDLATKGTVQ